MTYTNAGQLSEIATLLDSDEPVWPDRVVVTCGALLMTSATTLHDAIHATSEAPTRHRHPASGWWVSTVVCRLRP